MEFLIDRDEAVQITISVVAISLAMAIVFAQPEGALKYPREFLFFMLPILVTVGSGFILHEMGHKLVAIYYGAQAKFRMWIQGLVFMLVTSLFGVLFAAPGAVYIYSDRISKKQNGIISLAGPTVNITLLMLFVALQLVAPIQQYFSFLVTWGSNFSGFGISYGTLNAWQFGAAMNLMLALFNMIPAFPLDGSKVFAWKWSVWVVFVFLLLGLGAVLIDPGIVISWGIMLLIFAVLSKLLFR
ncbi:site-2 protease family protein [Candidatus Micrarchaeota archaeon]|nr:site-2 protease family protein [Candidatus Micrarchaeota archaeon]